MEMTSIYYERPPLFTTSRQLKGWLTIIHMDVRELTEEERKEYDVPDTYVDEKGAEHPQEAYTAIDTFVKHQNPLTQDDYGMVVSSIVRTLYSQDDVEALTQNYIVNPAKYADDWEDLQLWRNKAKAVAKEAVS